MGWARDPPFSDIMIPSRSDILSPLAPWPTRDERVKLCLTDEVLLPVPPQKLRASAAWVAFLPSTTPESTFKMNSHSNNTYNNQPNVLDKAAAGSSPRARRHLDAR